MCGLVGFISKKYFNDLSQDLSKASSCLSHRGPNDSGFFYDNDMGIGLAHRRLSIIDLSSAGHQPMTSDDVSIIYNGEIYNFKKIRKTLEGYGHKFKSNTDTEVVLKSYLQWGVDCLEKFIGMFAFAIWDGRKRRLFLARDRIGIKPLYYHFSNGTFLFASELKAFMAFSIFNKDIDPDSIPLFLHYLYIPAPKTVFKNTFKLLPGHFLTYENNTIKTHNYWQYPEMKVELSDSALNEEEKLQQLDDLLTQAVSDRMISDVPLGALLSGGIDSSIVVALMQKVNSSPVRTFSIGFKEKGYNEAKWAAKVARHLNTDHTELYVTPKEAIEIIPKLPGIYDEPFADSSAVPTYYVSKMARENVTVSLSGDGGDENFAGYRRYYFDMRENFIRNMIPERLRKPVFGTIGRLYPKADYLPRIFRGKAFISNVARDPVDAYFFSVSALYNDQKHSLLNGDVNKVLQGYDTRDLFYKIYQNAPANDHLSKIQYLDIKTYLCEDILTKVDRASMAVSLEVRCPILDHVFMEYVARIPSELKLAGTDGKHIFKKALKKYLPDNILYRKKMGFGVPILEWLRKDLKGYAKSLVLDGDASRLYLRKSFLEKIWNEHQRGIRNRSTELWIVMMLNLWHKKFG